MKPLSAILLCLLTGCTGLPDASTGLHNACLPEAIMMAKALQGKNIPARVLLIEAKEFKHAIAVYVYEGKAWGWDSYWKSNKLRGDANNADSMAREWLNKTTNATFIRAAFL